MKPVIPLFPTESKRPREAAFNGWFESSWDLRCGLEICERWGEPGAAPQREEALTASRTALPRSATAIA